MSSTSSGPGDQVNVDRDYDDADRGSVWRWLVPLLVLAIVAALLWTMLGSGGGTYPTTAGSNTTISTPVGGAGSTGATGSGPSGAGVTGSGATTKP